MAPYDHNGLGDRQLTNEHEHRGIPYKSPSKAAIIKLIAAEDENAARTTFAQFSRLPIEIQMLIWERSLPGPRVLAVDPQQHTLLLQNRRSKRDSSKLYFPPSSHTPNPAALSTCQTSRKVALMRYRLCFGTHNVYADLPGGDILYFGRWTECFRYPNELNETWFWTFLEPPEAVEEEGLEWTPRYLSPSLRADLEQVTHIALDHSSLTQIWLDESSGQTVIPPQSPTLLRDLKRFKSLKRVSLIYEYPRRFAISYSNRYPYTGLDIPDYSGSGQIILEPAIFDWVYNKTEQRLGEWPEIIACQHLWNYLIWAKDADADESASSPELDLVVARRLEDEPMMEYQKACGLERSELYYGSTNPDTYWLD